MMMEEYIDDDYIHFEDKKNLLQTIKYGYDKNFPWADDCLIQVLVKDFYRQVIKNMDKEQYLLEKERQQSGNVDDILELVGKSTISPS